MLFDNEMDHIRKRRTKEGNVDAKHPIRMGPHLPHLLAHLIDRSVAGADDTQGPASQTAITNSQVETQAMPP